MGHQGQWDLTRSTPHPTSRLSLSILLKEKAGLHSEVAYMVDQLGSTGARIQTQACWT